MLLPLLPENGYLADVLIIGGGGTNVHRHGGKVPSTGVDTFMVDARDTCFRLRAEPKEAEAKWQMLSPMQNRRVMLDSVLLPDGKVLVVNGVSKGFAGGAAAKGPARAEFAVRAAELYDPVADRWQTLAPAECTRLYHSTALLLPDARVLVAGSDHQVHAADTCSLATGEHAKFHGHSSLAYEYRMEVFTPPYLLTGLPRPVIEGPVGPPIVYGQQFAIAARDLPAMEIGELRVALLRPGSVTHGNNMSQRHVGLRIICKSDTHLVLEAPPNGCVAPPGYYMLFLVHRGVPSEAKFVQLLLSPSGQASPDQLPTSGVAVRLRADTGVLCDSAGSVASWLDLSGRGHDVHLRPDTTEPPPKFVWNGPNGQRAIRWNLIGTWGNVPDLDGACMESRNGPFLPGSGPYTAFVVTHPWPPTHKLSKGGDLGWGDLLGWGDPADRPKCEAFVGLRLGPGPNRSTLENDEIPMYPGKASLHEYWGEEGQFGAPIKVGHPLLPLDSAALIEMYYDGTNTGIWVNGTEVHKRLALPGVKNTGDGPLTIGRHGPNGAFFRGDVAEIVIYDRTLTGDERAGVRAYFRDRYDLWRDGTV